METERSAPSHESLKIILLAVLAVLLVGPLLLMAFMMPMMGMMWGMGTGGAAPISPLWGMGLMVGSVLVLAGIGYVLYALTRGRLGSGDPAIEELRVAYARGDLSEEEFEQRLAALERSKSQ